MKRNNGEHQKDLDYKISPELVMTMITCFLQFLTLLTNNGLACCVLEMVFIILILILCCAYLFKINSINRTIESKNKKIIQKQVEIEHKKKNSEVVHDLEYENSYIDKRMKEIDNCIKEKELFSSKYKRLICICVAAFLIIGILNADTIYAYLVETADIVDEDEYMREYNSNDEIIEGMSFYLENPDIIKDIPLEEERVIFYITQDEDINAKIKNHVQQLLDADKVDTFSNNLSLEEAADVNDASCRETEFDIAKEAAKTYAKNNNYIMWKNSLMSSSKLDEILELRLSVWNSDKCGEEIASLIANNYQDYALEYQNQGKNGYTILYYYMQTIKWSEYALSYESRQERKHFYYIKGRYFDIMNCLSIPKEYRDSAELIYNAMGEYEDY